MPGKNDENNASDHKAVISLADFKPAPITPADNAFHGSNNLLDIEWWYFEAIFTNGYSAHIGVRTFHIGKYGIVTVSVEFYHHGKRVRERKKIYLHHDCVFSQEFPYINVGDEVTIRFDTTQHAENNTWVYHVGVELEELGVDLAFTGTTEGWKYEPPSKNCWAVPLPKAEVEGSLRIDGEKHVVQGRGYHDHNWDYTIVTAMNNHGWYWGKITGEQQTVTWAKTFHTRDQSEHLAVVNMDADGYVMMEPKNISFVTKDAVRDHGQLIPTRFEFHGTGETTEGEPVRVDVEMKAVRTDFEKLFTINYWRYHVLASGHITVGSQKEELENKLQIMEFLLFQ